MNVSYVNIFKQIKILVLLVCLHVSFHYASEKAVALVGIGTSAALVGAGTGYSFATDEHTVAAGLVGFTAFAGLAAAWHKQVISSVEAVGVGAIMVVAAGLTYKKHMIRNVPGNANITLEKEGVSFELTAPWATQQQELEAQEFFSTNCQVKSGMIDKKSLQIRVKDNTSHNIKDNLEFCMGTWRYVLLNEELLCQNQRAALIQHMGVDFANYVANLHGKPYLTKVSGDFSFVVSPDIAVQADAQCPTVQELWPLRNCDDANNGELWKKFMVCIIICERFQQACYKTLHEAADKFQKNYSAYEHFKGACQSRENFKKSYSKDVHDGQKVPGDDTVPLLKALLKKMYSKYGTDMTLPPVK